MQTVENCAGPCLFFGFVLFGVLLAFRGMRFGGQGPRGSGPL